MKSLDASAKPHISCRSCCSAKTFCPVPGIGIGGRLTAPPTGSPGVVTHPRLPQIVACRFRALRSSKDGSQHSDSLQLPIGKKQLWSHKWAPRFDLLEYIPCDVALPAPAAQHSVPVALHDAVYPLQCSEVPSNAIICKVTA